MKNTKQKKETRWRSFIGLSALCVGLVTLGANCNSNQLAPPDPVTLEIWRPEDKKDVFNAAIEEYRKTYPHVKIEVRVFQDEEYEQALVDAWAKGEGPDIFSVQNWRLGKYKDFIAPMPESASLRTAHQEQKSFGKKTVVEDRAIVFPTAESLRNTYAAPVYTDVVFDDKIYGVPLSMDTLALYYNLDMLAQAQIAVPPATWTEFLDAVQKIVVLDDERKVVKTAAGIGTAENVPHNFDILSALMMQSGTQMTTDRGSVAFSGSDPENPDRFPAIEALEFYRDFSNPGKKSYTWNAEQPNAKDLFTQGSLAFYFGHYEELQEIEQQAPDLNFSYARLPQVDTANAVNVANYPVEAVYVNSENVDQAWNFIRFLTSEEQAKAFAESTGRVPALLSLLDQRKTDPKVEVFVAQALTATQWYHGHNPDAARDAFTQMITSASDLTQDLASSINIAADQVKLTIEEAKP